MRFFAPRLQLLRGAAMAALFAGPLPAFADDDGATKDKRCLRDMNIPDFSSGVPNATGCDETREAQQACQQARAKLAEAKNRAGESCQRREDIASAGAFCQGGSQSGSNSCARDEYAAQAGEARKSEKDKSARREQIRDAMKACRAQIERVRKSPNCELKDADALGRLADDADRRTEEVQRSGEEDGRQAADLERLRDEEGNRLRGLEPPSQTEPPKVADPGTNGPANGTPGGTAPGGNASPGGQGSPQQQAQNGGGQPSQQQGGGQPPQSGETPSTIQDQPQPALARPENPATRLAENDKIKNPETKLADVGPAAAIPSAFIATDLASLRAPAGTTRSPTFAAADAPSTTASSADSTRDMLRARLANALPATGAATSGSGASQGGDASGSSRAAAGASLFSGGTAPVPVDTTNDPGVSLGGGLRVSPTAASESLDSFQKQLSSPQLSMMGSETEAAVRRMVADNTEPPPASPDELEDGIGDRNGPSLFERTHASLETSQRRGLVRGVAAYR